MRHPLGTGVGTMCRGKRVVHIEIGELRERRREARVVLLLLGVETRVLQHQHVAPRNALGRLLGQHADAVLGEAHALAQHFAQRRGNRCQRHLRHALALGAVEVAADDRPCAPLPTSSRMVGVSRSMRVRSVILPSRTGTLRSARSSTRLPATSTSSRVRNDIDTVSDGRMPPDPSRKGWGRIRTATGCRTGPPCRTCGWRSPTRCRTSPSPGPARRPPRRSGSHRRCTTPGCG